MRLSQILFATMVALVVSNDNFAVAGSSTATTAKPEEVYAAVFRVKDGKVTDAMLKDINQNDGSVYYLNQDDSTEEERAVVHFPKFMTSGPLHWIFKKLGNLLLKVKKHTKYADRRLRIEA